MGKISPHHIVCLTSIFKQFFAAALFFVTYEAVKNVLEKRLPEAYQPVAHMTGASLGEVVSDSKH